MAIGGNGSRFFRRVHIMVIGDKSFQTTDAHRFATRLDSARALTFALRFLGTDSTADRGQRTGHRYDLIRFFELTFRHFGNKFGNGDIDGTPCHTGTIFTIQTALCLVYGHFRGIAQRNLLKVFISNVGIL